MSFVTDIEEGAVATVVPGGGVLVAVGKALSTAWKWLSSLPWYVLTIGALVLALAWTWHSRASWKAADASAEATIHEVQVAQDAADKAAQAAVTRVETKQTAITKDADHATDIALAGVRADYAAYRLHHPAAGSSPGSGDLPGVPEAPGGADCPAGAATAVPLAELTDFAEQGDLWRERIQKIKDWYAAQAGVDRTPAPPQ